MSEPTVWSSSAALDDAIHTAEEFCLRFGLPAQVSLEAIAGLPEEREAFMSWGRTKTGWGLMYVTTVSVSPLLEVSRTRKCIALLHFSKLVDELQRAAGELDALIAQAVAHVKETVEKGVIR